MSKNDDVLEKELADLENSSSSESMKAEREPEESSNKEAPPKKKNVKALVAVMAIAAGVVFLKGIGSDGESAESTNQVADSQPVTTSVAPQTTPEVSQSNDILDPDLAAIVEINRSAKETPTDPNMKQAEFGQINSGSIPISINQPISSLSMQPFAFQNTDGISEEDLDLKLASYATLNQYEADRTSFTAVNSEQSLQIQQLMSSVTALNQKLQKYEQLMESVELDIMMNMTKPEISNLMIVKPRFDCDECIEKASFTWEKADVVVAQNSVFMGFRVLITGDVLKLVSGTVEHVFTPEA